MVSAICGIVFAGGTVWNSWNNKNMRLQIEKLRGHISEARRQDREEMRDWINGSFMRSREAIQRMEGHESRLTRLEDRPSGHGV
jgi:hypothetical protein